MRASWKIIGLAGLAGVAATGVIVARKRRAQRHYDSDELRHRLHERLAQAANSGQSRQNLPQVQEVLQVERAGDADGGEALEALLARRLLPALGRRPWSPYPIGSDHSAMGEGGLQDLSGDRGGGGAAEPCADEHDGDGDLGVLGGREGHEPGVGVFGVGRVWA